MQSLESQTATIVTIPKLRHVDATYVVWHGNYVRWVEDSHTALLESAGIQFTEMESELGISPDVRHMGIQYKSPALLTDRLTARSTVHTHTAEHLRIDTVITRDPREEEPEEPTEICRCVTEFTPPDRTVMADYDEPSESHADVSLEAKTNYKHVGIFQSVWHGHFFEWFENARVEAFNRVNCSLEELRETHKRIPVVGAIDFYFENPLGMNRQFTIDSSISEISDSHMRFDAHFRLGESKTICRAKAMMFLIHEETHKPQRIPRYMREAVLGNEEFDFF
jgi:YbgC/YbaW family acyl-CoA thioester hydrolase